MWTFYQAVYLSLLCSAGLTLTSSASPSAASSSVSLIGSTHLTRPSSDTTSYSTGTAQSLRAIERQGDTTIACASTMRVHSRRLSSTVANIVSEESSSFSSPSSTVLRHGTMASSQSSASSGTTADDGSLSPNVSAIILGSVALVIVICICWLAARAEAGARENLYERADGVRHGPVGAARVEEGSSNRQDGVGHDNWPGFDGGGRL